MKKVELHQSAVAYLQSRLNILLSMDCREFDTDLQVLIDNLEQFKTHVFSPQDKILLVHMDTDYYDPLLPYGMIPINVVRIFKNLDIPLHALLFVTNHFGIRSEFENLVKDHHPLDRPKVVETLLSPTLLSESQYQLCEPAFDDIERSAICMMNKSRSHRLALFNFFLDNDLQEKIAISQNFNVK